MQTLTSIITAVGAIAGLAAALINLVASRKRQAGTGPDGDSNQEPPAALAVFREGACSQTHPINAPRRRSTQFAYGAEGLIRGDNRELGTAAAGPEDDEHEDDLEPDSHDL